MDSWLEISLNVNGELAEAVAEVLGRYAPGGVMTEQGVGFAPDEDEGTPAGPITVRAYLPVDENVEEKRQKLEEALFYLGMIQPLPKATFKPIADQNWMEAWKEHYHPIPIGKQLIIVPVWLKSPDEQRIPIRIDPGMAFGTGTHPTTQLCLELVEECSAEKPDTVIDVGCGSGILSIAALKLGARFALGVDIDAASVKASRENAEVNGIAVRQFAIGLGSVDEVLEGIFQIREAPLVLANILAPVILRLFEAGLAKLVSPGGSLVLSGILAEQAKAVEKAAKAKGFALVETHRMGDWVALLFRR